MSDAQVMTVSRNGQVSIPAAARTRWNTRHVLVVDLGDRVVMRPVDANALDEIRGKYTRRGPRSDRARRDARRTDTSTRQPR